MGKRFKLDINKHSEFELDLAPLLAVMVKLVPVLLVSSAFVQMMIIETELPQVVKKAIEEQVKNPKAAHIGVQLSKIDGVTITITDNGQQKVEVVALNKDKQLDLPQLHNKFVEIKKLYPQLFKIDINPNGDVAYSEIVKVMDEARKSRSKEVKFPVKDEKTGQDTMTDYMFPEVVFSNTMDG